MQLVDQAIVEFDGADSWEEDAGYESVGWEQIREQNLLIWMFEPRSHDISGYLCNKGLT